MDIKYVTIFFTIAKDLHISENSVTVAIFLYHEALLLLFSFSLYLVFSRDYSIVIYSLTEPIVCAQICNKYDNLFAHFLWIHMDSRGRWKTVNNQTEPIVHTSFEWKCSADPIVWACHDIRTYSENEFRGHGIKWSLGLKIQNLKSKIKNP